MIALRFLHDTPFDMFEGTYKLAVDCYGSGHVLIAVDRESGHIIIEIWGIHTVEEIENDLAKYSHWFTAEGDE